MFAIFKRELKSYFYSPIGYIFLAVMYFFGGQFFAQVLAQSSSQIDYVFQGLFSIVITIIPLLTMRLLSEDKKNKTDQLLFTAPVKLSGIIAGKYLAAFSVYFIGICSTLLYVIVMATFTTPNWNTFLGNFLALALLGGALISIGMFVSSLTENQVISAIGGFAAMMFIFLFDTIAQIMPVEFIANIFKELSFMSRYQDFIEGILNVSHIIFFVSVIVVFNFLTVRILERKRWS